MLHWETLLFGCYFVAPYELTNLCCSASKEPGERP
jgi:hypothetical protein